MPIFDLHVHTTKGSSDSGLTPEELIVEAQRIGLDGVCLTEHSGGWTEQDVERVFGEAGITVIRALEVETDMGHVLVFGLHSYSNGMHRVLNLRELVQRSGGLMIAAHPFRKLFNAPPHNDNLLYGTEPPKNAAEAATHPLFELVDEVEVVNGSNTEPENAMAQGVARSLGLAGTGGSDAHSVHGLGRCVTVFDGPIESEADLIEALRAKAFKPGLGLNIGALETLDMDARDQRS